MADTLRLDGHRWRPLAVPSEVLAELRVLVRDRHRLLGSQQAVEAQLRAALEAYHPAVARLFSSVDRAICLAFLRDYPSPEAAARVGQPRMQGFLDRHGYSGRAPGGLLVDRLRTNLMTAAAGSIEGHRFGALALADQLELLNAQLKVFERRSREVFHAHPDAHIFSSLPGAGLIIGAGLLAEIGEDRSRFPIPDSRFPIPDSRFPTADVLLAEAGLAPVTLASGKVTRVRFRYACNTRLRETFNWWAYTLERIDEPSRSRYMAALERGQHAHRALRTVGAS